MGVPSGMLPLITRTCIPPEKGVEETTLPVTQRYLKKIWRGGGSGNLNEALRQKMAQETPNIRKGKRGTRRRKTAMATRKAAE